LLFISIGATLERFPELPKQSRKYEKYQNTKL